MKSGEMVEAYIRARTRRGLAPHTLHTERLSLRRWVRGVPDDPNRIRRKHIERWVWAEGVGNTTRRHRLSQLRGLFRWAGVEGHVGHDPTAGVEQPKDPPRLPRFLRGDLSRRLVATAPDPRGRLILLLQLQEGLRRGEVAAALVADLDLDGRTLAVRGKGGRGEVTRRVPLSDETADAIVTYWQATQRRSSGPLVCSYVHPDRPLTPDYVSKLVSRWMYAADVKHSAFDGISAHSCRHTAAQDAVDRGAEIRAVQKFLGHSTVKTTEAYLRGAVEGIREAVGGRSYTE